MAQCSVGVSLGVRCENPEGSDPQRSEVSHDPVAAAQTYAHSQSPSMPALCGPQQIRHLLLKDFHVTQALNELTAQVSLFAGILFSEQSQ